MTFTRSSITAIAAAAALAVSAAPALASGGSGGGGGGTGGGGTVTSPAPPVGNPWTLCPEWATTGSVVQADGSILFANELGGIGCLVAQSSGGALSIAEVRAGAGWVSTIRSSDPNKLDVQFTWPADGTKHSILVQPGKTVIR